MGLSWDTTKINGIESGWNNFTNEAKKIRKGMILQKINGIGLEWKCFANQAK